MSLETLIPTKSSYEKALDDISFLKIKLIVPILVIIIVVTVGYLERMSFISDINTKDKFICKSTIRGGFSVVIDKNDGWILKDNYFIKDESSISARRCTPVEEIDNEH